MFHGMSVSFNPIGSWPLLVCAAVLVLVLTLWAYAQAPFLDRRMAVGGPLPAAPGDSSLLAGGAAALGRASGEEAAKRDDRLLA